MKVHVHCAMERARQPRRPDEYLKIAQRDRLALANEVTRLREIMHTADETVKACGHANCCSCCWCDMRRLFAANAAGGES